MRRTLPLNLSPEYTNTFTALTDTLSATFHQGGGVSTAGQKADVWGLSCSLHTATHQCEHSYPHAHSQSQTCSVELSSCKILLLSTARQELNHSSALLLFFKVEGQAHRNANTYIKTGYEIKWHKINRFNVSDMTRYLMEHELVNGCLG